MTRTQTPEWDNERIEAAIAWHVRLHSGDTEGTSWLEFAQWIEADATNSAAFDQIDQLWVELDAIGPEMTRPASEAMPPPARIRDFESARAQASRRPWRAALAAVAATIVILIGGALLWPKAPGFDHYATGFGQRRTISLADGSTIDLNSKSRMAVSLDKDLRRVTLDHGEALFEVAKDPNRPFLVSVGDRKVRVVGTIFDILRSDGVVTVTVKRGIVAVMPRDKPALQGQNAVAELRPGDQLVHREGTTVSTIRKIDPAQVLAWRQGRLIYNDASLAKIARDLNRYFATPIKPENTSVGALRFSGVLAIDDEQAVLKRLEVYLPVTAETSGHIVILRQRPANR